MEAGEMAQKLKCLAVLLEDWGSIPSTSQLTTAVVSGDLVHFSGLQTQRCIDTHSAKTLIHIK